jgi:hypothetical protein
VIPLLLISVRVDPGAIDSAKKGRRYLKDTFSELQIYRKFENIRNLGINKKSM